MKLVVACAFIAAFCWAEPANAPKAASRQDMIDALMRRSPGDGGQAKALDVDELRRSVRAGLNAPASENSANSFVVTPNRQVTQALSDLPWVNIMIYFDYDSVTIRPEAEADLTRLAETLSAPALANSRFMVAGHTDGRGRRDYNIELSQRRAEAVQKYILSRAPSIGNRLVAMGFGMEQLRNLQDPADASNRRVQLLNIGPAAAASGR